MQFEWSQDIWESRRHSKVLSLINPKAYFGSERFYTHD